jgi:hypothetical protein
VAKVAILGERERRERERKASGEKKREKSR